MPVKSVGNSLTATGLDLGSGVSQTEPDNLTASSARNAGASGINMPADRFSVPSFSDYNSTVRSPDAEANISHANAVSGSQDPSSLHQSGSSEEIMMGVIQKMMQKAFTQMGGAAPSAPPVDAQNTSIKNSPVPVSGEQMSQSAANSGSAPTLPSTGGMSTGGSSTQQGAPASVLVQSKPDEKMALGNLLHSLLKSDGSATFSDSIRFAAAGMTSNSNLPSGASRAPSQADMVSESGSASELMNKQNAWHPCQNMAPPKSALMRDGNILNRYYFQPESQKSSSTSRAQSTGRSPFNVERVRRDFPILDQKVNGKQLIWFDNAATSQKPNHVIDAISNFYRRDNSNIHRAAHALAARATDAYENARAIVQRHLNARSPNEIVFVRGTTEAINLVAQSWGRKNVGANDVIIVSEMEHHANIVPWQMLAAETGAVIKVIPVDDTGDLDLLAYQKMLSPAVKIVALSQASNVLGTVNPLPLIASMAKSVGAHVLVDGAQSIPHFRVDVQSMGCDWFVFSGHKVFGPTGIGALYGREELLRSMPPWQGGGNMIKDVTFEKTEYADLPAKFEAGTGILAGAVGLGAALEYVDSIGSEQAHMHEQALLADATERLLRIPGLQIIGQSKSKVAVISFVMDKLSSIEIGKMLDQDGIAVRSGHHCAQPILRRYGLESSVRTSFAFYNTHQEIDALCASLVRMRK